MKFIPSKPLKITLIIIFLIAVAVFIATSLIPIVNKCLSFRSEGIIPNQYIVVLNDDVDSNEVSVEMAETYGFTILDIYDAALNGFAAEIPNDVIDEVKKDKRIQYVENDSSFTVDDGDALTRFLAKHCRK